MAYIGHPVVSDPKYGPKTPHFAIKGQALHSWTLTFTHPVTAEELTFESPIPEDMGIIIEQLRKQQGL
jgi:23S rRNA pseudouridine1911/1915/1917 synthase